MPQRFVQQRTDVEYRADQRTCRERPRPWAARNRSGGKPVRGERQTSITSDTRTSFHVLNADRWTFGTRLLRVEAPALPLGRERRVSGALVGPGCAVVIL